MTRIKVEVGPADTDLMRSPVATPLVAGFVALLAVPALAVPALADPPAAALPPLPPALTADLSAAESADLAQLTSGSGVPVDALVRTPTGAAVVELDAGSATQAREAASLLDAQPSVDAAGLPTVVHVDDAGAGLGGMVAQNAVYQWDLAKINAVAARSVPAANLPAVTVAVLDTGIAANPQLTPYLAPGRNFSDSDPGDPTDTADRYFHGTHVAGTIGASVQQAGVEGIAAGVTLLPVKVLDDAGSGYTSDIASGIVWAADHGADVINLSLGGPGNDPTMQSAIDYARGKGVVVVAAVGNDAQNGNPVDYPGASNGVIGVGATDVNDGWASFSEHGPQVDVSAPGVGIQSLYLTSGIASASGTSMASPHVAAVAALLKAVHRAFTPDQVQSFLQTTGVDLGTAGRDDYYGAGRIDALAAVNAAVGTAPPAGPIDVLYRNLGGAAGVLGAAVSGDHSVAGGTGRTFAHGQILLAPGASAAHYLSDGAISSYYGTAGGPGGPLGFPTSDPSGVMRGGGVGQHFAGATVYWSPASGAHVISWISSGLWAAAGYEAGYLGYPTSDGSCGMRGGGCGQSFQGGTVYWSPASGSHLASWISQGLWAATGYENGFLGYPTGEGSCGLTGGGCAQTFQGGTVYWSLGSGSHAVRDGLGNQWARLGGQRGRLGYPTSEQYGVKGGLAQNFQHGTVTWTQKGNRYKVTYRR